MNIVLFQLVTVGAMFTFTLYEWISLRFTTDLEEDYGEPVWSMLAVRNGRARKRIRQIFARRKKLHRQIPLSEGSYIAGNRLSDEIYIDSSGPRIKLYLNVQKERIYLTVFKGSISIDNYCCNADRKNRIEIQEYERVRIADVDLQFIMRR